MDWLNEILFPFQWLVSAIMVGLHDGLGTIGMPAADGWTWTLAIIGLVLVIRAALIPGLSEATQGPAADAAPAAGPEETAGQVQGKIRPAVAAGHGPGTDGLVQKHGTNPFSACLPLLIQVPFFFALFTVLSGMAAAAGRGEGLGAMSPEQVVQFEESSIFGAPLSATCFTEAEGGNVVA